MTAVELGGCSASTPSTNAASHLARPIPQPPLNRPIWEGPHKIEVSTQPTPAVLRPGSPWRLNGHPSIAVPSSTVTKHLGSAVRRIRWVTRPDVNLRGPQTQKPEGNHPARS